MFRGLVASLPTGTNGGGFGRGGALSAVIHGVLLGAAVLGTRRAERPSEPPGDTTPVIWVIADDRPVDRPTDLPFGLRPMFAPLISNVPALMLPMPPIAPLELAVTPGAHIGIPFPGDHVVPDSRNAWGEGDVDEKPERLQTPPLEYPPLLRQAGFEGTVIIEVVVDTLGMPERGTLRVIQSGNRAFDGPASRAVLKSEFRPGRVRGRPVRVLVQIPVSFTIRRH